MWRSYFTSEDMRFMFFDRIRSWFQYKETNIAKGFVKNKDKILSHEDRKTRGRLANLEHALYLWIVYTRNDNLILINKMLIVKA